jgi:hypothetical protein
MLSRPQRRARGRADAPASSAAESGRPVAKTLASKDAALRASLVNALCIGRVVTTNVHHRRPPARLRAAGGGCRRDRSRPSIIPGRPPSKRLICRGDQRARASDGPAHEPDQNRSGGADNAGCRGSAPPGRRDAAEARGSRPRDAATGNGVGPTDHRTRQEGGVALRRSLSLRCERLSAGPSATASDDLGSSFLSIGWLPHS